jgi:hypothetical protein
MSKLKKVLILVQACDDAPYFDMQEAQQQTWDRMDVPGTETFYYYGNNKHNGLHVLDGKKLYCPCSEAYDMMHYRHKLAVEYLFSRDWDFIFRTNASSYVHKEKLLQFAQTLPLTNCFVSKGEKVMSGCGFFLSRDLVKIANDLIDDHPTPSEDMYIASVLNRAGYDLIEGGDRVDFNHHEEKPERECYHYRCKSDTEDRTKDIKAFEKLFRQFHS